MVVELDAEKKMYFRILFAQIKSITLGFLNPSSF